MAVNKKTFSVTMSPSLLEKLDAQCAEYGMNRSAFIAMTITMYLKTEEAKSALMSASTTAQTMKEIQDAQQIALWSEGASKKL